MDYMGTSTIASRVVCLSVYLSVYHNRESETDHAMQTAITRHVWTQGIVLDGVHIGVIWRIRLNDPCAALCQITLFSCYEYRSVLFRVFQTA